MRIIGGLAAVAAILVSAPVAAQAPRPKLIVAISVDQLSADLFAEYRSQWTGGLKRLSSGAVFPSGHQSHAATETCPGHSTILTGGRPARTGIIANNWFDPKATRKGSDGRTDYQVYCSEDPTAPGSTSRNYVVSPRLLNVPTLGDRLKVVAPATRVVSVAGKDRAAVMMGGHAIDQAWWWQNDGFATFRDRTGPPPAALAAVNARARQLIARPAPVKLPPACARYSVPVPISSISVGQLAARKAGDARLLRASADLDQLTVDLAMGLAAELGLGQGATPDLLILGLSATDYVGHSFGTEGAEMCAQLHALDAMLGRFFARLDARKLDYAVVLTADHGGHDAPERNVFHGLPAERVDPALLPDALDAALAREFGLTGRVLLADGPFGDFYLTDAVPAARRARVIASLRERLLAHPQIEAVFTREELGKPFKPGRSANDWPLLERMQAGFDPGRSGDLVVVLKPWVTPIPAGITSYVATHGSPWNYDRRVPILFWWKGIKGFEQPNAVETVDILPTLAPLVGLSVPVGEIDGRCLDLDPGEASTCP